MPNLIAPHGGYRNLKSFQTTTIIYDCETKRESNNVRSDIIAPSKAKQTRVHTLDLTVRFCESFIHDYRLRDQMVHAARSGRQNIAEGCQTSGTSKKSEMKLVGVARASLEELLLDYEDFLRQRNLTVWDKNNPKAQEVRALAYEVNRSYETYLTYYLSQESAANTLICLIHQANYLLDQQLRALENQFQEEGGFTERLYGARKRSRSVG